MDIKDIDLTNLEKFKDGAPWEAFAALRRDEPLFWNDETGGNQGFWSLTRHEDVVAVNRDDIRFSSEVGQVTLEEISEEDMLVRKSMIDTDGARHWALRKLLQREFSPRALALYEDFLRNLTRTTLDRALEQEEFDFVKEISADIPIRVLARMLDVPTDDTKKLIDWGNQMIANSDPDYTDVLAGSEESEKYRNLPFRSPAALEAFEYGFKLAAQRKGGDGTDLISKLVNQEPADGIPLSDLDYQNYFTLLIIAGNETTRHTISHSLLALIEHPDQLKWLQENPDRMQNAVEEFLRWASPLYHFRRTATEDVEMHGKTIKKGDKVVMWFASANRDESIFPDPEKFDVTRDRVDHLSFGKGGPHFCLGNGLARLEIKIVFEELLKRIESAELTGPVKMVRSNLVHGMKEMPVRMVLKK